LSWGSGDILASRTELTRAREVEDAMVLASVLEDADGLVRKVTILEGELVEAHQAREMAEEKFHILSDTSANGARWLVVSKMDHQKQFEELCLAIVGSSRARNHLLKRMQAAAICHIEMAGELAALRAIVTFTVELVLGHLSDETFRVESWMSWLPNSGSWWCCAHDLSGPASGSTTCSSDCHLIRPDGPTV
jgi:hypothetical protein